MTAMSLSCCARACCRRFSSSASLCFISFSFSAIKRSYSACSFAAAASAAALSLATLEDVDTRDAWLRRDEIGQTLFLTICQISGLSLFSLLILVHVVRSCFQTPEGLDLCKLHIYLACTGRLTLTEVKLLRCGDKLTQHVAGTRFWI